MAMEPTDRRVDINAMNAFTAAQVDGQGGCGALMLVHPAMSVDQVAANVDRFGFLGFKPYRWYAPDANECRITDMLPEPLIELADGRIKDVPNFWYDFSSVTYSDVLTLAFCHMPLSRIMFGTDFPCDLVRGTMVSFGLGWEQLAEKEIRGLNVTHCDPRPTYTVYETLRTARRAVQFEGFGAQQIEDLFYNNAVNFIFGDRHDPAP